MRIQLIYFLLIAISGCAFAENYESVELNGKTVSLNINKCQISYESKDINIDMEGSCFFIKENNSEKIRLKYYKDINSYVLLIVGDILPKDPEYPLTLQRDDCGSTVKSVLIKKTELIVPEKKLKNTVTCAGIGSDEKEFYFLSH